MNLSGIDLLSASRPHQDSQNNLVLAGLSPAAHSLIDKRLEEHKFPPGTLIWDVSDPPGQIVFPCSGMISVRVVIRDGHEVEVATVGREGGLPGWIKQRGTDTRCGPSPKSMSLHFPESVCCGRARERRNSACGRGV
jgi:hypothetical protein